MDKKSLQNVVVITSYDVEDCLPNAAKPNPGKKRMLFHFMDGTVRSIRCIADSQSLTGTIYVGRVDSLAPKIHAVFVKIGEDTVCYLPEDEVADAIFTHKPSKKAIAIGDELLVQLVRQPLKTKLACVTTRLCLSGHYAVVTTRPDKGLGISKKIPKGRQQVLREAFMSAFPEGAAFDCVLRTSCKEAEFSRIFEEINGLESQLLALLENASSKMRFSCLYQPQPDYISYIKDAYPGEISEIITDESSVYNTLIANRPLFSPDISLRHYQDTYPLSMLYSLHKELKLALQEKVWLPSGAYLLIEATEAFTVIDVNSGKKECGKKESYFYDINVEAAKEIARQLILRNISGIVIIDFIDLPTEEEQEQLLSRMRSLCKADHIPVRVVDFTKLQLMELTRKKTGPTLFQQIMQNNP